MSKINPELSDQAKRHIHRLKTQGASHTSIARAAGVSFATISLNMNRPIPFAPWVAFRILAVTLETANAHDKRRCANPNLATHEQTQKCIHHLQRLKDQGARTSTISELSGLTPPVINRTLSGATRPTALTAQKLLAVTEDEVHAHQGTPIGVKVEQEWDFMHNFFGYTPGQFTPWSARGLGITEDAVRKHLHRIGAAA